LGKDEIENKLGKIAIAELETTQFKKILRGFPVIAKEKEIIPLIEKERIGFLGFGKEERIWIKIIWIPCYLFQVSYSQSEGFIRKSLKTRRIWNLYDAIDGCWFLRFKREPTLTEVEVDNFLQPRIKDRKIKNKILKNFEKACQVITSRARLRYQQRLSALGIPLPTAAISIDKIVETYYPFYITLLQKGEKQRILAVDGALKTVSKVISNVLTRNLTYVVDCLNVHT